MSLPTVLFIDNTCPKPYDTKTLATEGLGGTEASVVRIADGLGRTRLFDVWVEQHNRTISSCDEEGGDVVYCSQNVVDRADYVICLRDPRIMLEARRRFPESKIYLWSHDLATQSLGHLLQAFIDSKCSANVCVSQFHKNQTQQVLLPYDYKGQFPNKVIYNPIDEDLKPDGTVYDKNKLVFFSSPHKGLEHTLLLFGHLRRHLPNVKLYVANPGYFSDHPGIDISSRSGIVSLGALPHSDVINHVRSSLGVFYPNCVFPETFGLVFAEANAVGTPVLTHNLGASKEVLDTHPGQVVDCRDVKSVIERIVQWHRGDRPTVRCKPQFRLKTVIRSWIELFRG